MLCCAASFVVAAYIIVRLASGAFYKAITFFSQIVSQNASGTKNHFRLRGADEL